MNWGSVENFFHMGGNGLYVWGSYAVTLLLMVLEPLLAARRRREALRQIRENREQESDR
jgi:heme exporter protein D